MKGRKPYEKCPVYTSDHFLLRAIERRDAEDLLRCYSDVSAVRLMNADNCGGTDFHFKTLNELKDYMEGWFDGYRRCIIVRFSIVDHQSGKAIGTVEMYDKDGYLMVPQMPPVKLSDNDTGILRIDLCSSYETQDYVGELLGLATQNFDYAFRVQHLLVKAIPVAVERISALRACGFVPVECNGVAPYGDYYTR